MLTRQIEDADLDFSCEAFQAARHDRRTGRMARKGVRFEVRLSSGTRVAMVSNHDLALRISERYRASRIVEVAS